MKNYEKLNFEQAHSEKDPFTEERYQQFYQHFPQGAKTVLDIGCNTGRGGQTLKSLDNNLIISGLDVVKDRLNRLPKDAYSNGIYGFSTEIPCEDGTFDVIVAGEFIEHIYASDVDKTITEIFRVLKIGGRLLLTTPNPGDIKRKMRKQSILGGSHVSQHFHDTLKLKLKMNGFSNLRVYGSGKVTRYIGSRFPYLHLYGSYLAIGDKF